VTAVQTSVLSDPHDRPLPSCASDATPSVRDRAGANTGWRMPICATFPLSDRILLRAGFSANGSPG
jgi:hypothetical protein